MNVIAIILLVFLFLKGKNINVLDFFKGLDIQSFAPILSIISPTFSNLLNKEEFKNLLSGELDFKSLIPILMEFLKPQTPTYNPPSTTNNSTFEGVNLSPIIDFASPEVLEFLQNEIEQNI